MKRKTIVLFTAISALLVAITAVIRVLMMSEKDFDYDYLDE